MSLDPAGVNWDDVRVFAALLESSNFRAAARRLGINASTCARRLDSLEAALGVRLFERSRAGITPTGAAEVLSPAVAMFRRAALSLTRAATALEEQPEGEVVISAPSAVATMLLVPRLGALMARYPKLRITVDTNNAFADLDAHDADLALRGAPGPGRLRGGETVVARLLARAPAVPVANPSYASQLGEVRDLSAVRWATFGRELAEVSWARKVLDHVPADAIVVRSDDAHTVFAAVHSGLAATWMTRVFTGSETLVELPLGPELRPLVADDEELWLVVHRALREVPRVAAVWSFLLESFGAA